MDPVVALPRQRIGVGQGIGARDVQMVLKSDELGRLVGLQKGVEGDVGRDARPTLCR